MDGNYGYIARFIDSSQKLRCGAILPQMARYLAALLCLFVNPLIRSQMPAQSPLEIRGTVLDSATGQPIASAMVAMETVPEGRRRLPALEETSSTPTQRAFTDEGGKFHFSVPADQTVQLRVWRRGYRADDTADVALLTVTPGQAHSVTVKLVPLGAIYGRVVNADGEPVPGLSVQALRVNILSGRRSVSEYANKTTDDRGEYRLWYLSPGAFYLKVAGRRAAYSGLGEMPILSEADETYPALYYPATPTQDSAQMLHLNAGQTIRADFIVAAQKAYKIRGALQGFNPYERVTIRLLRGDDPVGNRSLTNLASNVFEVYDVIPGTYALQAYNTRSTPPTFAETVVTVGNRDVSGVILAASAGAEVTGTVSFAGTPIQPDQPGRRGPARRYAAVTATPVSPGRSPVDSATGHASVDVDGKFSFKLRPGTYQIEVICPGFYTASIRSGTVDVLSDGLTVGPGGAPELDISLIAGGGRIEAAGAETTGETRPTVIAVRRYGSAIIPSLAYDFRDGRFIVQNLAPGEYTVYAWPSGREVEYYNPAALQALSAYGIPVSLREGATEQIQLKVAPKEEQ